LALFLFGVRLLSEGMEKLAGHRIREWLDRMTSNPYKGAVFGAGATAIVQSSSLLMVTMIGLINANLMTLEQAIGVMMGQEIGTTLTAQVVAFKIGDFSYLFIALGLVMSEFFSDRTVRRWGQVILGFGILFVGMQTMSTALKALAQAPFVEQWLAYMGQYPLTGVLAGTIATAVVQSSSAVTGLVVAMGLSQTITLPGAIGLLLGANIGTCVTGLIASLRLSAASKQASIAQIIINVVGTLIFLPFITPFATLSSYTSSSLPRQIANAHTIFNIATSIILFPFIGTLARLSRRLVPIGSAEDETELTEYIDPSQFRFPDLALSEAQKELYRIGEKSAEMITLSRQAIVERDLDAAQQVIEMESDLVNPLCTVLEEFLNELLHEDLDDGQKWFSFRLKRRITDVERVADLTEDLVRLAQQEVPPGSILGKKAMADIDELFQWTHRTYTLALQALRDGDPEMAQLACDLEDKMDQRYWKVRRKLSKQLKAGKIEPEADALYLELLRCLERISDHADNLGISVMRVWSAEGKPFYEPMGTRTNDTTSAESS
jgi:phosphate:Na+ symporter